jgi:hypothetical protein
MVEDYQIQRNLEGICRVIGTVGAISALFTYGHYEGNMGYLQGGIIDSSMFFFYCFLSLPIGFGIGGGIGENIGEHISDYIINRRTLKERDKWYKEHCRRRDNAKRDNLKLD